MIFMDPLWLPSLYGHPGRENPLLDLRQVPHSVEVWGPKSQIWLNKMGTPNPPRSFFGGIFMVNQLAAGVASSVHVCGLKRRWFSAGNRLAGGVNQWKRSMVSPQNIS